MAGIYVHIPFCKKKCHYCDFYSTTNKELCDRFILALGREVELRDKYLEGESIRSIYFGGGSPSMLSIHQIESILDEIRNKFVISSSAELTFESNPDDLDIAYCRGIKDLGFNRLSIGIQSFDDNILKFLNRRHSAEGGENAVNIAKEAGFNNVSIDLMFGIPGMSNEIYEQTLNKALDFEVNHISAYHLSIEPKTVLYKRLEKGNINVVHEDVSLHQFDMTVEKLQERGYKHYEVSNYGLDGYESKHNWLYWNNGKYLGLGPSAHSYDGNSRQWNIDDVRKYIDFILNGSEFFEKETLGIDDKFNEYILTGLRTCTGVSEKYVNNEFSGEVYKHFVDVLQKTINQGCIEEISDQQWALNKEGFYILDLIIGNFIISK